MKKILSFAIFLACILSAGIPYATEAPTLKELAEQKDIKKKIEEVAEEKTAGPYDEFNRSTPRSSLVGFALAARNNDFKRAVNYMDLRNLPFSLDEDLNGEDLVRKLVIVAKRSMTIDIDDLSEEPSGHLDDGLPSYRDRITTVKTEKGPVDILMQRVPRKDGVKIWKISNKTIAQIPALDEELGYGIIGDKMSLVFPHYTVIGLELWQITLLAILITIGYMIAIIVTHIIIKLILISQRFKTERLKQFIVGPLRFLITVLFYRTTFDLTAPTLAAKAFFAANTFLIAAILWISLGLVGLIMSRMADRMEQSGQHDAVVLLKPATTGIKIIFIIFALMSWVDNLGYEVTTILAGLGVGGIAVALAAQKSLENLIGAITIYASRPVKVGDVCKFDNMVGVVEEIGLRATRLRTLARTVVHIPNAAFASGTYRKPY